MAGARRWSPLIFVFLIGLLGCSLFGDDKKGPWDTKIPEGEDFDAAFATWSPDGRRVAFQHHIGLGSPDPGAYDQLWTVDLETGDRRMIFPGRVVEPDWSPDGRWFVFYSFTIPQYVYKVDSNGKSLTRLTGPGSAIPLENTVSAQWNPDGDQILFTVSAGEPRGISLMDANGDSASILIPYGITGAWYPDGERIAYANWDMSQPEGRRLQLFSARSDGTDIRKLTDLPDSDYLSQPAVSPDGEQIAFVQLGTDRNQEIFVMDVDGSRIRQLTRSPGMAQRPQWHPDGKRILFGRFIPNVSRRIYLLDVETLQVEPVFPAKNK